MVPGRKARAESGFPGSVFDSPLPCTHKVSARQGYKSSQFCNSLNKDNPLAETLRVPGIGISGTDPFTLVLSITWISGPETIVNLQIFLFIWLFTVLWTIRVQLFVLVKFSWTLPSVLTFQRISRSKMGISACFSRFSPTFPNFLYINF